MYVMYTCSMAVCVSFAYSYSLWSMAKDCSRPILGGSVGKPGNRPIVACGLLRSFLCWSFCPGLGCKPFPTPVHGSVLIGATDTGHVKLTYSCSGSMHIVGSSELVCHPDADSQNRGGVWRKTGNESSSIVENAPVCAGKEQPALVMSFCLSSPGIISNSS